MSWKKIAYLDEVAILTSVHPSNIKVQTAAEGSGTAAAREDHLHDIDVGLPAAITEGASQNAGSATSLARSDHVHESPATWAPDAHTLASHSELKLDTLAEVTLNAGVTVDGLLIKDSIVADSSKLEGSSKSQVQDHTPKAHTLDSHSEIKLDTLAEKTAEAGVTIDSCLIKDGKAADSNLLEGSNKVTVQDHTPKAHTLNSHTAATGAVDFGKQEATTLVLHKATGAPSTPVEGQVYYENGDNHAYVYVVA